jgi:hypothetical protein
MILTNILLVLIAGLIVYIFSEMKRDADMMQDNIRELCRRVADTNNILVRIEENTDKTSKMNL